MASVSLKLLVDREKNRVVFAECEKDFVDILFSFLTLPMGTIVRLLGKKSSLGCMDKLYESVENLDTKYFETEACKTMLLESRSAAERLFEDLIVSVDDLEPWIIYSCPSFDCFTKTNRLYSTIRGARCPCGKSMDKSLDLNDAEDGVFLKGEAAYIINDDLHVAPSTVRATLCLLQTKGFKDAEALEMQTVDVHRHEVLGLLKRLLLSKTPLTDVFLHQLDEVKSDEKEVELTEPAQVKLESVKLESEIEAADHEKTINVKVLHNKITKEVIYAEAGNDFVDALLSFLTVPLGSVVKLLNKHSSLGCVDTLYSSVEDLDADRNFIKSKECKNMLLSPKLYSHFDCSNQIIKIETNPSTQCTVHGCKTCFNYGISTKCTHNLNVVSLIEVNPKLQNSRTENGGGFARNSVRFIVSNEMGITALSSISAINVIKHLKAPFDNLVEKEVTFGEAEVLDLLRACLTSSNALGGILSPKKSTKLM